MAFDDETLDAVFEKTRGQCHICRKQLTRSNHGQPDGYGSWEVDHSKPKAKGGTDHLNNLYPICTSCNCKKGDRPAREVRAEHGYSRPPLSPQEVERKKQGSTLGGGLLGAAFGGAAGGPVGALVGGAIGAGIGANSKPGAR